MVDYQKAINELKETEKRINNSFTELTALDYQRAEHFHDYIKKHNQDDLARFLKETKASNLLLKIIVGDFHKTLEYVKLIKKETEKEGRRHYYFKKLLNRAGLMESILRDSFRQRRTQINICSSLLPARSVTNKIVFLKNIVTALKEKHLVLSFGKEKDLIIRFAGIFKNEKERIDSLFSLFQAHLTENKNNQHNNPNNYSNNTNDNNNHSQNNKNNFSAAGVPLTVVVLVPVVGSAYGLAVSAALQWANRYNSNCRKLMGHSKHEVKDGPAV